MLMMVELLLDATLAFLSARRVEMYSAVPWRCCVVMYCTVSVLLSSSSCCTVEMETVEKSTTYVTEVVG